MTVRILNVLPAPLPRQGELWALKKNFQKKRKTLLTEIEDVITNEDANGFVAGSDIFDNGGRVRNILRQTDQGSLRRSGSSTELGWVFILSHGHQANQMVCAHTVFCEGEKLCM